MVCHSHLFKTFPQFIMIYTIKGFDIISKSVDVFQELSCFFKDPTDVGNSISDSSPSETLKIQVFVNIMLSQRSICLFFSSSIFFYILFFSSDFHNSVFQITFPFFYLSYFDIDLF